MTSAFSQGISCAYGPTTRFSATLDTRLTNRGLAIDAELAPFCGRVFRVGARIDRFVDERTGKMRFMKTPAVALEGVVCQSLYAGQRLFARAASICGAARFGWNVRGLRRACHGDCRLWQLAHPGQWTASRSADEGRGAAADGGTPDRVRLSSRCFPVRAIESSTRAAILSCMNTIKSISVCGLGKLGACMAATFAARGFKVVGVDIDPQKVSAINDGRPPVDEPLLAKTICAGRSRLSATTDPSGAVATDATFFIPPSPSRPDGSFSNEFLLKAMQSVAKAVKAAGKRNHLFVCSSTTTPGALDAVLIPMLERELGGVCGRDFGVCYNPEFIALGDVINGLLAPDLVSDR